MSVTGSMSMQASVHEEQLGGSAQALHVGAVLHGLEIRRQCEPSSDDSQTPVSPAASEAGRLNSQASPKPRYRRPLAGSLASLNGLIQFWAPTAGTEPVPQWASSSGTWVHGVDSVGFGGIVQTPRP